MQQRMPISSSTKDYLKMKGPKRKQRSPWENNKKRKNTNNVPDAQELEELTEIETEFHSSLFKMEVEELLNEVRPQVPSEKLDVFLKTLENTILRMPETETYCIDDFPISVQLPIVRKIPTDKGVFRFAPPTKFLKIGSFELGTVCSSKCGFVDLAVEIPKSCWQSMDFMNERYHRKRALYLACIAQALMEAEFIHEIKFAYLHDCHLKPVLLITPKEIVDVTICLTAFPAEGTFKLQRYIPSKNNVRSSWMLKKAENDLSVPTPYYNSTVLEDILLPNLCSFLQESIVNQNIKDGIILVKIWCQQRGLLSGYGRLNGFLISMFVAYLLKKQKINLFMNSYQIFRCTLLAFQHEKFEESISLAEEAEGQPSIEDFKKVSANVFLERSGFLNLTYSVSKETIDMLKHEAKLGLKILDSEMPNCFNLLFMTKITAFQKFEYLILLKGPKKFRKFSEKLCLEEEYLNFGENRVACVVPKVCEILRKGLHKRILLIDVIKEHADSWSVNDKPPSPNCGLLCIGLLLNPEFPNENIEKGPLADDPQAKEFRDFWGELSEMRRFQDGTIREAVVWPARNIEEKRKVFLQMLKDIFKRHLGAEEKSITVTGTDVDCLLHLPEQMLGPDFKNYGTGEEEHVALMLSLTCLSKMLRKLEDLPLTISSVQGISPAFRFSEVFPPLPASFKDKSMCFESGSKLKLKNNSPKVTPYIPPLEVVIGFEGSGKWPDDLEALRRVKAAFFIKIAELVKSKYSLVAVPNLNYVDVVKDGFVFRLVIACHKELFLMKQHNLPSGVTKIRETDESLKFEVTTDLLPKLSSILHGLHQQHNSYGTACRLAKRWISSQLMCGYIHELAVELLVAHCYCHPEPFTCPSSPQTAFLRFLCLIVNHDWKISPLILNFNHELQKSEIDKIYSSFTSQRSTLPAMVIVTPFDRRGTLFTRKKPHPVILKRLCVLAKATLDVLEKNLSAIQKFDVKTICRPPLDSYHLLIHLKHEAISKLSHAVDINEEDLDNLPQLELCNDNARQVYPVVDFDPAFKYLEELRTNYDDFAHFFYDSCGGDVIAVVWKTSAFSQKDFKVSYVNGCITNDDLVVGNLECIIEDFKILGNGLVDYLSRQKNPS